MRLADLLRQGEQTMTVCNSCRYCEHFCPVFPAIEQRLTFAKGDLTYLANLCHNCGECLFACQYAPPHEFGINVPRTLAALRLASYQAYSWPRALGAAFERQGAAATLMLSAAFTLVLFVATWALNRPALSSPAADAGFYDVVPHRILVSLFGGVSIFAVTAIAIGLGRFWLDPRLASGRPVGIGHVARGLRDAFTVRHLHTAGADCASAEEHRTPWRRVWHHCTFYGFLLCLASTTVAAVYHSAFGWQAPYGYASAPVLLGAAGGVGLLAGPIGLWRLRRTRDPALADPRQGGLDDSFIVLLALTSLTGLLLLALRETTWMASLLIVHLGVVLAFFVALPYGKFVHGFYRAAALIMSARDDSA